MALSGSLNTTKYEGRYLKLTWTATQDIATNSSTISWKVVGAGESTTGAGWYMTGPIQVVINGKTVYSSSTRFKLYEGTNVASGTLKIEHNPDGTKSFSARMKAAIYEASYNKSGSSSWTLDAIPRAATITAASDFNDEENPTITYSNLLGDAIEGLSACISLTGAKADVPYRDIDKNGSTYTFELTEDDRNTLRAAVTSGYSVKVYFYVRTIMDGEYYFNKIAKTFTIINGEPTIAPTVAEGNSKIAALTGSTAAYVANASIINYEVNPTVRKGATIKSISVQFGNYKGTTATGTIENVATSGDITFTLTDSRNNKATAKISANVLSYATPQCKILEDTLVTTATEITISVACDWIDMWFDGTTDGSDGGVHNTAILHYRYKEQNGEYGDWVSVNQNSFRDIAATQGSVFTQGFYDIYINGLDSLSTYVIQAIITDELFSVEDYTEKALSDSTLTLNMIPVFDWGKEDFSVNVPFNIKDKAYIYDNQEEEYKEVISAYYDEIRLGYGNFEKLGIEDNHSYTSVSGADTTIYGNNINFVLPLNNVTREQGKLNMPGFYDIVEDQGDDGTYAYRRWQNGLLEVWRIAPSSVSYDITNAYGSMYYSSTKRLNTSGNASQFVSIESVHLTIDKKGANGLPTGVVVSATLSNGQATVNYMVSNPVSGNFTFYPHVYIIGRWK